MIEDLKITRELINETPGDESAKNIFLGWIGHCQATYEDGLASITFYAPEYGYIGELSLIGGELYFDTPEQGEQRSVVDSQTLVFAQALCGLSPQQTR